MKPLLRLFIFALIPVFCFGQQLSQNKKTIDSLNLLINSVSGIQQRTDLYEKIISLQYVTDINGILKNTDALKTMHSNEKCKKCLAIALFYEGMHYYLKGDYNKAVSVFEETKYEADKVNEETKGNKALTMLSALYFFQNDYAKATQYADILIENGKAQDSATSGLIDGYFMKGLVYDDQSYYSLALENYILADSVNDILRNEYHRTTQAKIYNNLSIVFIQKKDFDKAFHYLNSINQFYIKENDTEGIYSSKQNLGYLEVEKGNYDDAIQILNETGAYYKKIKNNRSESEANLLLGRAYFGKKEYTQAIYHLKLSAQSFKEAGALVDSGLSFSYLGDSYLAIGNLELSEINLSKALEIFDEAEAHGAQIKSLKSLVELNKKRNRFSEALENYQKLDSINKIYQVKQNEKQVFELETKYQTKKKEQEIAVLTSQKELAEEQRANQRNLMLAGLGVTTLAGIFFFVQYRQRQKTNKKLKELDTAKSTFFANISHEFRTPLSLIKGPIEDQLEQTTLNGNHRKNLLAAQRNTQRLEGLVEQLLALSKLESGAMKLQVQPTNLNSFLRAQTQSFQYIASGKNNTYTVALQETEEPSWVDQDVIEKICVNLLGNAFKYSPEGATIYVKSNLVDGHLEFSVQNTGISLSEKQQQDIFIRFYQTQTNNPGSGIGLALTKELVHLHKGNLTVTSSEDQGVLFTVRIPITEDTYTHKEKLDAQLYTTTSTFTEETVPLIETEVTTLEDAPLLLIIDDSKEIRNYVASIFENTYTILTATNGKEG